MADTSYETTQRRSPEIEAAQATYLDLLMKQAGQAPTAAGITAMGPQVAGQNILSQAAQQSAARQSGLGSLQFDPTTGAVMGAGQGTGIAGYQPFLDQAQAYSGPNAYQQFMSPYQQDVIDTTLSEFDRQRQITQQTQNAQAVNAGAFGGGREGVQRAEYGALSDMNRAALQNQLLQQGYGQAQQAAGNAFTQQNQLASLQPSLAATGIQQLGAAGNTNLAYQQAVLDAQRGQAQLAYQEPYTRLGVLGSGIASQVSGSPTMSTVTQQGVQTPSALAQAVTTGAGAYGLGSLFG
jgi:hypothetical protein